jgi:hypothetical protein
MFKRYAALVCLFALVIMALAPASAMAATVTKTGTYGGNTNLKMIVTYSPGSGAWAGYDYVSSVYASQVSTAKAYRSMDCKVWNLPNSPAAGEWRSSTPVKYALSETKTWYPGRYVKSGSNSVHVTFFAGPASWLTVGYSTLWAYNL